LGVFALSGPAAAATPSSPPRSSGAAGSYVTVPADSAPLHLTVVLAPSSRSGLTALAQSRTKATRVQRAAAVARTAPTSSARAVTVAALQAAGLTVLKQTSWDLQVSVSPSRAEQLFGMKLVGSGTSRHPDRRVGLPAFLGKNVTAVLGFDQRPVVKPRAAHTKTELQDAYQIPQPGAGGGAGTTVATVQFSGWNSSDLQAYATDQNITTYPQAGQLAQISVDGANHTVPDGGGGEAEVAIDQEMILAAAPLANQRAYFAPNDSLGFYDAFAAVASDVAAFNITALSTSWGMCEGLADPGYVPAYRDAISRAVASGATTFAASGDSGALDCGNPTPAVDLPASFPEVVGVGGTSLTGSVGNWSETAWGGSGGGLSSLYGRPSYQSAACASCATRAVPDISAIADPGSGTQIGVRVIVNGVAHDAGGTSVSSPLMAGALASTLSKLSCTSSGIGDIHAALYNHEDSTHFRDPVTGSNGQYTAGSGYDLVTGLGSPQWNNFTAAELLPGGVCPETITTNFLGNTTGGPLKVGVPVSQQLTSNGTAPFTWTVTGGSLPPGLSLSTAGVLSGTPTQVVTRQPVTISVTDSATTPRTASRAYTLSVVPLGRFVPLRMARVFDSTVGTAQKKIPMAGRGGVAANATAVVANVWVYLPSTSGWIRVTPYGRDAAVGTQQFAKGKTIANLVTLGLVQGALQARLSAGTARVLVDVGGYYTTNGAVAGASSFTPIPTVRLFDKTIGTAQALVPLAGRHGVAGNATAVVANVWVFLPSGSGWVRVTPAGQDAGVGTQQFIKGQTIANLVVVKLVGGNAQVRLSTGTARVLVDVSGYYSGAVAGSDFTPVQPVRVLDYPVGASPVGFAMVDFNTVPTVPAWATAVAMNVWAYQPGSSGWIRVTPYLQDAGVGTQQFVRGQTISNMSIVKLNDGSIQVRVSSGTVRILFDVVGYYS
jgi:hypothetical protein